jgi:hypothetical protein
MTSETGLPIRGGWGYGKGDACIIDLDPGDDESPAAVTVEYEFVAARIEAEMVDHAEAGHRYFDIRHDLLQQALVRDETAIFDCLTFEISALPERDWLALKQEYEGPEGCGHPSFDLETHLCKRESLRIRFTREFWFDIGRSFGH